MPDNRAAPTPAPAPPRKPLTMAEINEYASAYHDYVRSAVGPDDAVPALRDKYWAAYTKLEDRLTEVATLTARLRALESAAWRLVDAAADVEREYPPYAEEVATLRAALRPPRSEGGQP